MKCSIIIRVFNAEKTIEKSINSALNQNFPKGDYEIVIVNDGSTDGSAAILDEYEKYSNIKIHTQENLKGIVAANNGFKISTGRYITLLDSDDYFEPSLLKKLSDILDQNAELDFVYPSYYERSIHGALNIVNPKNIFETVSIGTLYRRASLAVDGFFHENANFAEYDMLLRTFEKWKSYHYPEALFTYVRRKDSSTADKRFLDNAILQLINLHPDKIELISKIRKY